MVTLFWKTKAACAGVVPDGERNELLLTAVADQLQQVAARGPGVVDGEAQRGRPRATHRPDTEAHGRRRLRSGRHHVAPVDQPSPESLVVTHPVGVDPHRLGRRVHEEGHVVPCRRADLAGEPFECVIGLHEVDDPIQGSRSLVLRDEPRCGWHHDATQQRRLVHGWVCVAVLRRSLGAGRWPLPRRLWTRMAAVRTAGDDQTCCTRRARCRNPQEATAIDRLAHAVIVSGVRIRPGGSRHLTCRPMTRALSLPAPVRRCVAHLVRAAWDMAGAVGAIGPDDRTRPSLRRHGARGVPHLPAGCHLQRAPHSRRCGHDRGSVHLHHRGDGARARRCPPTRWYASGAAASSVGVRTSSATGRSRSATTSRRAPTSTSPIRTTATRIRSSRSVGQWPTEAAVRIGSGSWLGANVVVLPGAQIGEHVVVAAGAVVRGVIPGSVRDRRGPGQDRPPVGRGTGVGRREGRASGP